jgi:hypothetical protein
MEETAPQRVYPLREIFNAVRWIVRTGAPLALAAPRFPALARRLSTDPPLAGRPKQTEINPHITINTDHDNSGWETP